MRHVPLSCYVLASSFDLNRELSDPESPLHDHDRRADIDGFTVLVWSTTPNPNHVLTQLFPRSDIAEAAESQSTCAVIIVERSGRTLALPLGHGHHKVAHYADPYIGLRHWLARTTEGTLRALGRRGLTRHRVHTEKRAGEQVPTPVLAPDGQQALAFLTAEVTGVGKARVAPDHLRAAIPMDREKLKAKLDALLECAAGPESEIPLHMLGVFPVPRSLHETLDEALLDHPAMGCVAAPSNDDWFVDDLQLPCSLLELIDAAAPAAPPEVLRMQAWYRTDGGQRHSSVVSRLTEAEIEHERVRYIRVIGHWYQVPQATWSRGADELDTLTVDAPPEWATIIAHDEGEWNVKAAARRCATHLDKALVHPPGSPSSVELCDLLDPDHGLVLVKSYKGQASGTSHVVSQIHASVALLDDGTAVADFLDDHGVKGAALNVMTVVLLDARLDPTRPLPYLLALSLLEASKVAHRAGLAFRLMRVPWQPPARLAAK